MTKRRIWWLVVLALVTGGLVWLWDVFIEDGNFRIMSADTVYRSAQLAGHDWEEVRSKHPFASIVNLRGPNPDKDWYGPELEYAKAHGIEHYDLALSANKQPDLATTEKLVEMMRAAPKPMLIHCKQGADRTGLASALYAYAIMGQPADVAEKQLSIRVRAFPLVDQPDGCDGPGFAAYVAAHPQEAGVPAAPGV